MPPRALRVGGKRADQTDRGYAGHVSAIRGTHVPSGALRCSKRFSATFDRGRMEHLVQTKRRNSMRIQTEKRATGIEPATFSLGSGHHIAESPVNAEASEGGSVTPSHSASYSTQNATPEAHADPELAAVVAAWSDLPAAVRAGIAAMIRAAGGIANGGEATR